MFLIVDVLHSQYRGISLITIRCLSSNSFGPIYLSVKISFAAHYDKYSNGIAWGTGENAQDRACVRHGVAILMC